MHPDGKEWPANKDVKKKKDDLLGKVPEGTKSKGTGILMCLDFEGIWHK